MMEKWRSLLSGLKFFRFSVIILFVGAVVYAAPKVIDFDILNDLTVGNDATISNDLTVTNDATVSNDLFVTNDATVTNNLGVTAAATIGTGMTLSAGVIDTPDGVVGAPPYSFTSDPDSGVFSGAANVLSLGTGGVASHFVKSASGFQNLSIGQGTGLTGDTTSIFVTRTFAGGNTATLFNGNETASGYTSFVLETGVATNTKSQIIQYNSAQTAESLDHRMVMRNQVGDGISLVGQEATSDLRMYAGGGVAANGFALFDPAGVVFDMDGTLSLTSDLAFEVRGTVTQGSKIASTLTEAERDAIGTPTEGSIIYSSTNNRYEFENGTAWVPFTDGSANDTLSNLGTTVINTDLISDTDITDDLGTTSERWKDLHVQKVTGAANALTLEGSTILWVDGTEGTSGECLISSDTGGTAEWATCPGAAGGDAWGDVVDADIIPDGNNTRDIGSDALRFAETHTGSLGATILTGNNTGAFTNTTSVIVDGDTNADSSYDVTFNATFFGQQVDVSAFAWIKTSDATTGLGKFIFTHNDFSTRYKWMMRLVNGKFRVDISTDGTNSGSSTKIWDAPDLYNDGEWHQLGFTFNTNSLKMYADGKQIADALLDKLTNGTVNSLFANTTDPIRIGSTGDAAASSNAWEGLIDEPTWWSVELDAGEVRELWNGGRVFDYTTHSQVAALEELWRADGSSTSVLNGDVNSQDGAVQSNADITTSDMPPVLTADSLELKSATNGDVLIQANGTGDVLLSGANIDFTNSTLIGADLMHHRYSPAPSGEITAVRVFLNVTAGSWETQRDNSNSVDSITDSGVGNITVNWVTDFWTLSPNCVSNAILVDVCVRTSTGGTTTVDLDVFTCSTGSLIDVDFSMICYGEAN